MFDFLIEVLLLEHKNIVLDMNIKNILVGNLVLFEMFLNIIYPYKMNKIITYFKILTC